MAVAFLIEPSRESGDERMASLFWLSDDAWGAIKPHLPKNQPGRGGSTIGG
jgi:hypothetical protein